MLVPYIKTKAKRLANGGWKLTLTETDKETNKVIGVVHATTDKWGNLLRVKANRGTPVSCLEKMRQTILTTYAEANVIRAAIYKLSEKYNINSEAFITIVAPCGYPHNFIGRKIIVKIEQPSLFPCGYMSDQQLKKRAVETYIRSMPGYGKKFFLAYTKENGSERWFDLVSCREICIDDIYTERFKQ